MPKECFNDTFPDDYLSLTGENFQLIDKITRDQETIQEQEFWPDGTPKTTAEFAEESARIAEELLGLRVPSPPVDSTAQIKQSQNITQQPNLTDLDG